MVGRRARRRDSEHRAADAVSHADLTCWRTGHDPRHGEHVRSLRAFEESLSIQLLDRLAPCRAHADYAADSVSAVLERQTRLCQGLLSSNDRQYAETVQH